VSEVIEIVKPQTFTNITVVDITEKKSVELVKELNQTVTKREDIIVETIKPIDVKN
jgi:hypothetical protein